MSPVDRSQHLEWVQFLRTLDEFRLPATDADVTLEQLQEAADRNDETWPVVMLDRLRWERHVLMRLHRGAAEYDNRSLARPAAELLDELSEDAADLGGWSAIAQHAVEADDDLDDEQRALIAQALRDAALAGATAWARLDQARAVLTAGESAAT